MSKTAAAITHTAATGATSGLTISSDNGFVVVKSTSLYVDVEDVRFTSKTIGIAGTTNLLSLASTGVSITGSLAVNGALTMTDLSLSGDIVLSKTAATFTHTAAAGATSGLTISSDNGSWTWRTCGSRAKISASPGPRR